jgi:hypothetical protein
MTPEQRRRAKYWYDKVQPFVEERCGRGSLTEKRFMELCERGVALMRKAKAKRRREDTLRKELDQLERRVRRLEAKL